MTNCQRCFDMNPDAMAEHLQRAPLTSNGDVYCDKCLGCGDVLVMRICFRTDKVPFQVLLAELAQRIGR